MEQMSTNANILGMDKEKVATIRLKRKTGEKDKETKIGAF
jgi:gamma-glutamylcysteine synthetase